MPFTAEHSLRCREDFPALSRTTQGLNLAYLDGPGGSQVPKIVIDTLGDFYATCNVNTHGNFWPSQEVDRRMAAAREALAAFLSLTAAAAGVPQIGAWITADQGAPNGVPIRDCATHHQIWAYAFESDTSGADLSITDTDHCNVTEGLTGTTQFAGGTFSNCQGLHHHRVKLLQDNGDGSSTTLCAGTDPKSGFLCSSDWNSDLSTSPPTNTTQCTVDGQQTSLRTQYANDGRHYGACANRVISAGSVGINN